MICFPSHTPIKHPITLNPIYNNETPYFPISIKFIASNENVEKVVKPPATPAMRELERMIALFFLLKITHKYNKKSSFYDVTNGYIS